MGQKNRIDRIVKKLRSNDAKTREEGNHEILKIGKEGLSLEESVQALKAAAQTFPPLQFKLYDSSAHLIYAAASNPRPEHIPIIGEIFPKLGLKARSAALGHLARIQTRDATFAYMKLVKEYANSGGLEELITRPLRSPLRDVDVFFPELLGYASNPKLAPGIFDFCIDACYKGKVDLGSLVPYAPTVIAAYKRFKEVLLPKQRAGGIAWMWADDYISPREECGVVLDLMGFIRAPEVVAELNHALAFADTKLKGFAAISLLRQGVNVDPEAIRAVAADAAMRNWAYDSLRKFDRIFAFPTEYSSQEAFAEADMVNWLTFGTELGRAPDEIELMKMVSVDTETEDGILDYFLFRFRTFEPHWAAKDGWMAGISGPFLRKESPTTRSRGDTFSAFEKWESKSPEEHLGKVQEILARWRKHSARGRIQDQV